MSSPAHSIVSRPISFSFAKIFPLKWRTQRQKYLSGNYISLRSLHPPEGYYVLSCRHSVDTKINAIPCERQCESLQLLGVNGPNQDRPGHLPDLLPTVPGGLCLPGLLASAQHVIIRHQSCPACALQMLCAQGVLWQEENQRFYQTLLRFYNRGTRNCRCVNLEQSTGYQKSSVGQTASMEGMDWQRFRSGRFSRHNLRFVTVFIYLRLANQCM